MLEFPSLRGCVLNLTKREENHPVQTGGFSGVYKIDRQECLSYQLRVIAIHRLAEKRFPHMGRRLLHHFIPRNVTLKSMQE